ncbi:MAG: polyhydroxyalkanoate synthesis regulator DNA-binding domain-containing protein [Bacteroidota bacterium]
MSDAPQPAASAAPPRLIKRYGSRKLYDTAESRYISLDEIARLIREGAQIRVEDNKTGEDVTAAVLTQLIAEESRRDGNTLPKGFLHDVIRMGERLSLNAARVSERVSETAVRAGEQAVRAGSESVRQVQQQVEDFVKTSMDRFTPASRAKTDDDASGASGPDIRDEMARLRARLEALESHLDTLGSAPTDKNPDEQGDR